MLKDIIVVVSDDNYMVNRRPFDLLGTCGM